MLPKLPEVGDTIVVRGVVKEITQSYVGLSASYLDQNGETGRVLVSRIVEVIPKPWEPKVGDHVRVSNSSWNGYAIEVLAVGNEYVFGKYSRTPGESSRPCMGKELVIKKENVISAD